MRLDGHPVIAEWDADAGRLLGRLRTPLTPGRHELSVEAADRVGNVTRERAVFTVDILPLSLFHLPGGDIPLEDFEKHIQEQQSVYGFLRQRLSLEIHHGIAWIRPLSAEQYIADKLQIRVGGNILHIEQVDFDVDGEPVALSDEYYVADASFYIYRSSQGT
jgi:GntR family transcriptional regulator